MATENLAGRVSAQGLLGMGLYKRSQGRVTRQVTFAVALLTLLIGCWRISEQPWMNLAGVWGKYAIVGALLLISCWASLRLVNYPKFADFLIAVEAEMAKVSWPSRGELLRSCLVVIFTIFFLAALILVYDVLWRNIFRWLGVVG